jgi:hypothetical protein
MVPEGRFWEQAATGEAVELGRVRVWDPPRQLVFDFYIGTDAAHPTEVTITFIPEGPCTRVTVDHGPLPVSLELFQRRAPAYDRSWEALLASLSAAP